jgi:hypothetical protein
MMSENKLLSRLLPLNQPILVGFSLIFCLSTAIGRVCLGVNSALASRYTTLLIPAFIGIYFQITMLNRHWLRFFSFELLMVVMLGSLFPFSGQDSRVIKFYSVDKSIWKTFYLQTGDYNLCDQQTGFKVYPNDSTRIENSLNFLRVNHLNLFSEDTQK